MISVPRKVGPFSTASHTVKREKLVLGLVVQNSLLDQGGEHSEKNVAQTLTKANLRPTLSPEATPTTSARADYSSFYCT